MQYKVRHHVIAATLILLAGSVSIIRLAAPPSTAGIAHPTYQPIPSEAFAPLEHPPRLTGPIATVSPAASPSATEGPSVAPTPKPTPRPSQRPSQPRRTPTPLRASHRISGIATWYCLTGVSKCMYVHPGGLYAAAGPALRAAIGPHWRGTVVTVTANGLSVRVQLADWCACGGGHLIDLYSDAMRVIDPAFRRNGGAYVAVRW